MGVVAGVVDHLLGGRVRDRPDTNHPVTLPEPVIIEISTPRAMLSVIGEWNKPKDMRPLTGRVYVFGHFKKFLFKFKRVVPVELNISFRNPLKSSDE